MEPDPVQRRSTRPPAPLPRRDFFKKALAALIGGVVTVVPAAAGLLVFLDPLRRRRRQRRRSGRHRAGEFTDVAPLVRRPARRRAPAVPGARERVDAWNRHPAAPVGAVYLKRDQDAPDNVVAFNVVCPHAGCFVEAGPRPAGGPAGSSAPATTARSTPTARIVQGKCVSPRGLDELAVDEDALKAGSVRVKFQNFVAGTHEKIPTT